MHEATGEIPDALQNKPKLSHWVAQYYSAFHVLNDSRMVREGSIGSIPLSEIFAYMQMFEIDKLDEREHFTKMVKALDRVYVKHINAKLKASREKALKKSGSGTRARRR